MNEKYKDYEKLLRYSSWDYIEREKLYQDKQDAYKRKEYEQLLRFIHEGNTKDEQIELTILKIEDGDVVGNRVVTFEPEDSTKFRKEVKERVFSETQLAELILEWT